MPPSPDPVIKKAKTEGRSPVAISKDGGCKEDSAVTLLRDYCRIKSVQPNPDYKGCVEFLKAQAARLELEYYVKEMVPGKPIFVMTWPGTDPSLPSLLLNSHTDVVPVFPESWKYDAFEAVKDERGDIYARGIQDMKSVGIQHIEAIYRLKMVQEKRLKRTVHMCFIADEEIGGHDGMMKFVVDESFKKLNIGMTLDEGLASGEDDASIPVYFGERHVFWLKFRCKGKPGHGSRFIENTAGEKVQYLMNKLLGLREEEKERYNGDPNVDLGEVTTINLTHMSGGVQMNVVPNEFTVGFDMRITPTTDLKEFTTRLERWCEEAGGDIDMEFTRKTINDQLTSVANDDPWFKAMLTAASKHSIKITPKIFPAATDSCYIRSLGIPALGFSPMPNTPILLHDHNEMLNEKVFLKGIDIFVDIIEEMTSV